MVTSRRRCKPPARRRHLRPGAGLATLLGLLHPSWWPGWGVPAWAEPSPQKGPRSPHPGRSRLLPILARFLLPATLWTRVWRGHVHPTHPPHAHPLITPAPPGAGPAIKAIRSSFFSTGMFLHAVHCVHASGRPPGPGCPRPPPQPPHGCPLPGLPTVPTPRGRCCCCWK